MGFLMKRFLSKNFFKKKIAIEKCCYRTTFIWKMLLSNNISKETDVIEQHFYGSCCYRSSDNFSIGKVVIEQHCDGKCCQRIKFLRKCCCRTAILWEMLSNKISMKNIVIERFYGKCCYRTYPWKRLFRKTFL